MTDSEVESRFFNFPPTTLELIRSYRSRPEPALVEPILQAIFAKYAPERDLTAFSRAEGIQNAFGLESITLLEVILDLQDALGIVLTDDELRGLRSLDETIALVSQKVRALAPLSTAAGLRTP